MGGPGAIPITIDPPGDAPPIPIGPTTPAPTGPLTNIPTPGDIVEYVGKGVLATGADVWHWIQGRAASAVTDLASIEATIANTVVNVVEAYVGASQQSLISFINDAVDFTSFVSANAFAQIGALATAVINDVGYLDRVVYGLLEDVIGIEANIIPSIEQRLLDLGTATGAFIRLAVADVQAWAIDNIYTPLDAKIWGVGERAEADIADGLSNVLSEAKAYADAHAASIAAAVAAAAAAAAAATTWIDDCGEPMCQVQGPKTDLGKLFKALQLAADAAFLAELANLTEPQLVALLTSVGTKAATYIDFLESNFVSGGETIGATVTNAIAANL